MLLFPSEAAKETLTRYRPAWLSQASTTATQTRNRLACICEERVKVRVASAGMGNEVSSGLPSVSALYSDGLCCEPCTEEDDRDEVASFGTPSRVTAAYTAAATPQRGSIDIYGNFTSVDSKGNVTTTTNLTAAEAAAAAVRTPPSRAAVAAAIAAAVSAAAASNAASSTLKKHAYENMTDRNNSEGIETCAEEADTADGMIRYIRVGEPVLKNININTAPGPDPMLDLNKPHPQNGPFLGSPSRSTYEVYEEPSSNGHDYHDDDDSSPEPASPPRWSTGKASVFDRRLQAVTQLPSSSSSRHKTRSHFSVGGGTSRPTIVPPSPTTPGSGFRRKRNRPRTDPETRNHVVTEEERIWKSAWESDGYGGTLPSKKPGKPLRLRVTETYPFDLYKTNSTPRQDHYDGGDDYGGAFDTSFSPMMDQMVTFDPFFNCSEYCIETAEGLPYGNGLRIKMGGGGSAGGGGGNGSFMTLVDASDKLFAAIKSRHTYEPSFVIYSRKPHYEGQSPSSLSYDHGRQSLYAWALVKKDGRDMEDDVNIYMVNCNQTSHANHRRDQNIGHGRVRYSQGAMTHDKRHGYSRMSSSMSSDNSLGQINTMSGKGRFFQKDATFRSKHGFTENTHTHTLIVRKDPETRNNGDIPCCLILRDPFDLDVFNLTIAPGVDPLLVLCYLAVHAKMDLEPKMSGDI